MKIMFVDRQLSDKRNQSPLSSISKLLFVRYFLGMLELEQEQYMQEGSASNAEGWGIGFTRYDKSSRIHEQKCLWDGSNDKSRFNIWVN